MLQKIKLDREILHAAHDFLQMLLHQYSFASPSVALCVLPGEIGHCCLAMRILETSSAKLGHVLTVATAECMVR
jgi:hypothetical protein